VELEGGKGWTDSQAVCELCVVIFPLSSCGVFQQRVKKQESKHHAFVFLLFILYSLSFRWALIIMRRVSAREGLDRLI
jgi:hypothetical protein